MTRLNKLNETMVTVNGGWSSWVSNGCPVTCGGAYQVFNRACDNPIPINGGRPCPGSTVKRGICNPETCAGELGIVTNFSFVFFLLVFASDRLFRLTNYNYSCQLVVSEDKE